MRKDQLMAKHWLIEAEKIDKNDENLKQCKQLLFPSGKAREEDIPSTNLYKQKVFSLDISLQLHPILLKLHSATCSECFS